jgi:hypothetical protein
MREEKDGMFFEKGIDPCPSVKSVVKNSRLSEVNHGSHGLPRMRVVET